MINYEKVAEKIFSVIKGHDHDLIMFTDEGMETSNAEEARRFFVRKPNYMVTLDGEARHIKLNKNSNVPLEDMESVMKQLRNLANSNMLKTEIRVFGKEITPKDFAYQAKNLKGSAMENIQEASFSRMHGFKKTSYQTLESTKIVVRHHRPIDEEVQGSRARNIKAIFIEHAGERFRFPHNNLAGARAMARHINEGGNMQDAVGQYIIESIANYNKLMEFVRYARTNKLINENSEDIIKTIRESVGVIRREISKLQGAKTYGPMSETIQTRDPNVIEEEDTTELKDMFTVRKFDEQMGEILPIVKKLMDNKQVWRDALVEASEKEIAISEKTELSETDVFEFDSPVQRMGYQVRDIANRMIGESDLQTFVSKVAGKLIEGEQISAFEKKIVGNVLGNAVIREEEELCEGCGEIKESCKCSTKDVIDLISEQFELKMKMVEHEDIFTEDAPTKRECPGCGDFSMDLQDRYGDELFYVCNTCGEEMEDRLIELPDIINCPNCSDEAYSFNKALCDTCGYSEDEASLYQENVNEASAFPNLKEWWNEDPDEIMSFLYWRKGQLPPSKFKGNAWARNWYKIAQNLAKKSPPPADYEMPEKPEPMEQECSRCSGRGWWPANDEACFKCDGKGTVVEADDHHAGEVEAGAHSGMPTGDFDVNTTDVSEIADAVIDDLAGDFDDPDMILRAITNLIGSDDPAVDDVYQEVLDRVNFQDDEGQPTEYEEWQDVYGGDDWDFGQYDENVEEDVITELDREWERPDRDYRSLSAKSDCPSCGGTGANTGRKMLTHGWNCPDCKGTGKVLEGSESVWEPDCPDCNGTGKAQDSIFDDDECTRCGGEGYLKDE